jgi:predicted transcriptional regulator
VARKPARSEFDLRGDLQAQVMAAVWKLGEAKVEDVRAQLRRPRQAAYTTIQTVMNRLVDRGLLTRERQGKAFVYRARYEESEYLARAIGDRLAGASPNTRRAALVTLVEGLRGDELDEIARLAKRVKRRRAGA